MKRLVCDVIKERPLFFQFETQLKDQIVELDCSRQAKEEAVKERMEMTQKHSVLQAYFNQREAELQKQLGLQVQ